MLETNKLSDFIGKEVEAYGRITRKRELGNKITFIMLKTHLGEIQCIMKNKDTKNFGNNFIVKITGIIVYNKTIKSGMPGFEIQATDIKVINKAEPNAIVSTSNINKRIEYRYLDLRNQKTMAIFKIKSKVLWVIRNFMIEHKFIEVYSSKLAGKSTEGPLDAFPVNYFGKKAYLSVSNAIPHIVILTGDIPKIFEIGPNFRGINSKTKRHVNEYTTLDFGASFMDRGDIMELSAQLINRIVKYLRESGTPELSLFNVPWELLDRFDIITHAEAVEIIKSEMLDIKNVNPREINTQTYEILKRKFKNFLWIIDFPEEQKSFYVKSKNVNRKKLCLNFQLWHPMAYNLMDGSERIINYEEAKASIIRKELNPENFEFYLNALKYGAPPMTCAGFAVDRFMQLLLGLDDIREVILFPKDQINIPL